MCLTTEQQGRCCLASEMDIRHGQTLDVHSLNLPRYPQSQRKPILERGVQTPSPQNGVPV